MMYQTVYKTKAASTWDPTLKLNDMKPALCVNLGDTNADLKIALHAWLHIKTIPIKYRIPKLKNSRVIYPWSVDFS